ELLNRVKDVALDAYQHQDLPFEKLVEELRPERDLARMPLFQTMFVLQNAPLPRLEMSGLDLSPIEFDPGVAKFDLILSLTETAQGLKGFIEYSTDLFDAWRIQRMAEHFRTVIEGVIANPEQKIHQIELMTGIEREQILLKWNETAIEYPRDRSI